MTGKVWHLILKRKVWSSFLTSVAEPASVSVLEFSLVESLEVALLEACILKIALPAQLDIGERLTKLAEELSPLVVALLSLALLLKLGSQFSDLALQRKGERCFHRLVQVVVEWICEVLVLAADYLELAKLSKLEALFKARQLLDTLKLSVKQFVQGS